jgi:hypothetical protein
MDPHEISERLFEEIKDEFLLVAGYPAEEIGDTYERLSVAYQAIALCHLLQSGGNDDYRENLTRSAHARRFFLSRLAARGITDDRRLALSRTEALLDAITAGHHGLAREIAELSPVDWNERWEYEDDYCFYRYLHVFLGGKTGQAPEILARFERALDGAPDPRLRILRALHTREPEAFLAGLVAHMSEVRQKAEERKELLLEPDFAAYTHWPRTFVSVEGLALLSLARATGMQVSGNIPLCPPAAQLPVANLDCEDYFQGLDRELRAAGRSR